MNKAENNKVLYLGCNEGFFSTQASLAGASSVTGVDLCKEDIQLSKEIRDEITGLDNIEYIQADAVVMNRNKWFKEHISETTIKDKRDLVEKNSKENRAEA